MIHTEKKVEHLKGTTTVGIVCKDGVVFGADSRATAGYLVASKVARKIYKITDQIGATIAGGVADTQAIVNLLRAESGYYAMREGIQLDAGAVSKVAANLLQDSRTFPYLANLIIGGVDGDGFKIYFIDLDGTRIEEKMTAIGSGSLVAFGVLENEFKEGMSVAEALPIAVKALKTAMKRDIATGNEVHVAKITKEGYRELSHEEIKNLA